MGLFANVFIKINNTQVVIIKPVVIVNKDNLRSLAKKVSKLSEKKFFAVFSMMLLF